MTISRINMPELRDPLTNVLDYLPDKDKRVFNAVSKAFKHAIFLYFLDKIFTPDLCGEPASSPHLLRAHRQIVHSINGNPLPLPGICSKKFKNNNKKRNLSTFRPTPDGKNFIQSFRNTIEIWDIKTGTCIHTLQETDTHTDIIKHIRLTPDGKRLIAGFNDAPTIKIWDIKTGTCIHTLTGHTKKAMSITLTPDGNSLISGSRDETIKIWDIKTGTCIRTLIGYKTSARYITPTPDGKSLALQSVCSKTIEIWDIKTDTCVHTLRGHTDYINIMRITSDGNRLISGSQDTTIKIWDIKTGTCIRTLTKDTNIVSALKLGVTTITLTPDENYLISASYDNSIKIWDIKTGTCIRIIKDLPDNVSKITFTPDRKNLILTFISSQTVMIYDVCPLLEEEMSSTTSPEQIARIALLDIGQYLEAIADRIERQYGELIPAAVPFTIKRIKTLPNAIKQAIYAQLKNPHCRSLCIEGDENVSDPRSIKHSVEKFFSRMNQLPQDIQDAFYEELHKTAPPDSQYLTMRNALRVASAALGIAAVGTAPS